MIFEDNEERGAETVDEKKLQKFAWEIRRGIIESIISKGGGHIGGTLDMAELFAVLYGSILRIKPEQPDWDGRDYLVCSKGHAGPCVYATLALKGFFPYEELQTLNQNGTNLPGHCDRNKVPGVDVTTGSLGQGLSIACGLALGAKLSRTDQRVFCVLGDGELDEGQNWEAALFAAHQHLGNLTAILDWNKMQIDGSNNEVLSLGDIGAKFTAFGWEVARVEGRDIPGIHSKIEESGKNREVPFLIILDTVKGAGVPCIEAIENNHCIGFPKKLGEKALAELDEQAKNWRWRFQNDPKI